MTMLKQSFPYIVAGVVLVLLYSLLGYSLFKKNDNAEKILEDKLRTLDGIYASSNLPSEELIAALEKDNMKLIDKYTKLREKLPIAKELSLPEGINLSLFFLQELKNVKEKLKTKAKEKGVDILTEDLGLLNILPSDKEAPVLIKNLYITEMIANLLIETGVNSINFIEVGVVEKTDIYEGIPLILTVNCDTLSLTELLFNLENTNKGFFIVKDFSLVSKIGDREVSAPSATYYGREVSSTPLGRPGGPSMPGRPGGPSMLEGREEERSIQTDLELSVIRWRGL